MLSSELDDLDIKPTYDFSYKTVIDTIMEYLSSYLNNYIYDYLSLTNTYTLSISIFVFPTSYLQVSKCAGATAKLVYTEPRLALIVPYQLAFGFASSFVPFYVFGGYHHLTNLTIIVFYTSFSLSLTS